MSKPDDLKNDQPSQPPDGGATTAQPTATRKEGPTFLGKYGTWIALVALLMVMGAIAIPNLMRSRIAPGEASHVGSLRQYVSGCISYSNMHPELGYPANLSLLGPGGDGLLDEMLAPPGGVTTASKSGYSFTYTPGKPDESRRVNTFTISARPLKYRGTGQRNLFVDESGVIRFTVEDRPATAQDPPIQ